MALLAFGSMVHTAECVRGILADEGIDAGVINARFAKPLDEKMLKKLASEYDMIFTLEEGTVSCGFGQAVTEWYSRNGYDVTVRSVGLPDCFIEHGAVSVLKKKYKIDAESIAENILESWKRKQTGTEMR